VLCPRSAGIDLNLHGVRRRHVEGSGALLSGLPPQDVQKSTSMQTGSSVEILRGPGGNDNEYYAHCLQESTSIQTGSGIDILRGPGVITNECYAHRLQASTTIQTGSVVDILRARERFSMGFLRKTPGGVLVGLSKER